jgi:hypothetical protein
MNENIEFRVLLIDIVNTLSNNDYKRFTFVLGDILHRSKREDASLSSTLDAIEELFSQGKINGQQFSFLIDVFARIKCHSAAHRLRRTVAAKIVRPPVFSIFFCQSMC